MSMRTSGRSWVAALAAVVASVVIIPTLCAPTSGQALPRLFQDSFEARPEQPHEPRLKVRGRRAHARLDALELQHCR